MILVLLAETSAGPLRLATEALEVAVPGVGVVPFGPGLQVEGDLDVLLTVGGDVGRRELRFGGGAGLPWEPWQVIGLVGTAQVWQVAPGAVSLAEGRLVISGRLDEVEVDTGGWAASVVVDPVEDRGWLLAPAAVVGPSTWPRTDARRADDGDPAWTGTPQAQPGVEDACYPVLIGRPGQGVPLRALGLALETTVPCAPALLVETSPAVTTLTDHTLVVSAGRIAATEVRRISTDQNGDPCFEDVAVRAVRDQRGQLVSVVSPSAALRVPTADSESWTCLVEGAGVLDPYGPGPLTRADHVLRWALGQSTLPVDWTQLPRLSRLSRLRIDTAIYSQVRPWDWIQGELLSVLPCEVAVGPRGLYLWPVLAGDQVSADAASVRLVEGEGCSRLGPLLAEPWAPVTRLTVRFALDARAGRTMRRVVVGAGEGALLDLWAQRAEAVAGRREAELDVPVTSDEHTATLLGLARVRAACRPAYRVDLAVGSKSPAARAMPGDVVSYTDRTLAVQSVGQVYRVTDAGAAVVLGVRVSQPAAGAAT